MIVEGLYTIDVKPAMLRKFMKDLSVKVGMTIIYGPIVKDLARKVNPFHGGLECVLIWAESGASVYTWEKEKFFTLDIYTCKKFNPTIVVKFAKEFFAAKQIVSKNV